MKAIVAGTPIELEGEPAEIAQLVELLASGAVMVEHKHRWRLGDADDAGVQLGECWCGQSRAFAPFGETNAITQRVAARQGGGRPAHEPAEPRAATAGASNKGPRPLCEDCGRRHRVGNCKVRAA